MEQLPPASARSAWGRLEGFIAVALMFLLLSAIAAAPVPKEATAFSLGQFGELTDPKTKCRCELSSAGVLSVNVPIDHPASEPNEAGSIRLFAGRQVRGDFALTVRAVVPLASPGALKTPFQVWAAGVGIAAVDDPKLGGAVLTSQETWDRDVNTVALFRYSRRIQPPFLGLQGSQGQRTPVKPGEPMWLRLTRRGEVLTGEWSADGKTWAETSEERVPNLPSNVMVGPIVARNVEAPFTATLDKYELKPLPKIGKK